MFYPLLVYAILSVIIIVLTFRLVTTSQLLFIAQRQLGQTKEGRSAAQQKAQRAEEICQEVLDYLDQALKNAGQALDVREHMDVIGTQLRSLVEYIESPYQVELNNPRSYRPGRHALNSVPTGYDVEESIA
jgi:hypothetical protein